MGRFMIIMLIGLLISGMIVMGCSDFDDSDPDEPPQDTVLTVKPGRHLFVTMETATGADPRDFDFLVAIPAVHAITAGNPSILCVTAENMLSEDPYFADYLFRYDTELAYTLNGYTGTVPGADRVTQLEAASTPELSKLIAQTFWSRTKYAILVLEDDYQNALQGSALASLLTAPLIYVESGKEDALTSVLAELQTQTVIYLGSNSIDFPWETTTLTNPGAIAHWVNQRGLELNYMVLTNYEDRSAADGPKLSLVAPLCAARRGGLVLPVSPPTSAFDVLSDLEEYYTQRGSYPEYLAIVGSASSIPLNYTGSISGEIGTDFHYSNADDDSFPDIAIGRIIANNASEGSLLVSRISTYDLLRDNVWPRQFVETGSWFFAEGTPLVRNYGYEENEFLLGKDAGSLERIEAGIIFHSAHSTWYAMGDAFDLNSTSVLAPAIVFSGGCSVAGIDSAPDHRYIIKHLNKLGVVATIASPRTATASVIQVHIECLNRMLLGDTVGKAFQHAVRSLTVNVLDHEGPYFERERYNMMLLGDPALVIQAPEAPEIDPAYSTLGDGYVDISVPEEYFSTPLNQALMDEWGWTGNVLHVASKPGITPRTAWGGQYDEHRHYYTAYFLTDQNIASVTQQEDLVPPLGMIGSFHIDDNQDGSKMVLWNVRVMDFNQETNELISQTTHVRFIVEFK